MKVCVINFSGNVGKTTVAAHLIAPRLGAPIFSVESLNSDASADGVELEQMKGKQYADLQAEMLMRDSSVVDVGASNVEIFLKLMGDFAGSHEDYDLFVVPVVKDKKQLTDSVNTLHTLRHMGVPAAKLRVVFNMVEPDDDLQSDFAALLATTEDLAMTTRRAVVHKNEVFERLKGTGRSLASVIADRTDYRAQLRLTSDEDEKHALVNRIAEQRLAVACSRNLDSAFAAIMA